MESHGPAKSRFAVGIFDSWEKFHGGLHDLATRGLGIDRVNCLALQKVFGRATSAAPLREPMRVREFAFPGNSGPIACTLGPLAERLSHAAPAGATSLREALAIWLLPRHADYFNAKVEAEAIQLWLHIANTEEERSACHSLLALSSDAVGVHDLVSSRNE